MKPWHTETKNDPEELIPISRSPSPEEESNEIFSLDDEHKRYKNHDLKSDIKLKRLYFSVTRKITGYWVKFIITASALQFIARLFDKGLEGPEYIALITTTTATLVGFWAIVGAYLFPRRGNKSD